MKMIDYKRSKQKKLIMIGGILLAAVAAILIGGDTPLNGIEFLFERPAIEQAAGAYFRAEMEHNLPQVYARLAPSSPYKRAHNYQQFLQDVADSPVRIQTYRIVDIYRFRNNDNKAIYPAVEKLVQVEVDVDLYFQDTGGRNSYNYCFTFLREKGVWYKG